MTAKIFARPADRVIATFRWNDWVHATLVEDDKGYLLKADFDAVPSMLIQKKTVSKRIAVDPSSNRYILAVKTFAELLSMLEKARRFTKF